MVAFYARDATDRLKRGALARGVQLKRFLLALLFYMKHQSLMTTNKTEIETLGDEIAKTKEYIEGKQDEFVNRYAEFHKGNSPTTHLQHTFTYALGRENENRKEVAEVSSIFQLESMLNHPKMGWTKDSIEEAYRDLASLREEVNAYFDEFDFTK